MHRDIQSAERLMRQCARPFVIDGNLEITKSNWCKAYQHWDTEVFAKPYNRGAWLFFDHRLFADSMPSCLPEAAVLSDFVEIFWSKDTNQLTMTELYQVVSIVGKGLGIVATKFIKRGTLILKEGEFSRSFIGQKKILIWQVHRYRSHKRFDSFM